MHDERTVWLIGVGIPVSRLILSEAMERLSRLELANRTDLKIG